MPTIAEIREKYPQYADLSDQQLAEGLHKKYYSDLSFEDFATRIGYSASSPRDRYYAKYGALDPLDRPPMLPGEMTPEERARSRFAPPPTSGIRKFIEQISAANDRVLSAPNRNIGTLESLGSMASGAVALPVASVAGIGTEAARGLGLTGARGEDIAERVQQAIIYQPQTESGRAQSEYLGTLTEPLAESGVDNAFLPLAGQVHALRAAQQTRQGALAFKAAAERAWRERPDVPTSADLADASNRLYARAEQSGVVIHPKSTARAAKMIRQIVDRENLGRLPPKINEAVSILEERVAQNRPLTLIEADKVRQIIGDAFASNDVSDRRLASLIKERYDRDYLGKLGPQDVISGNEPEAVQILKDARALYRRRSNAELIEGAIHEAQRKGEGKFTQAGEEHALRQEFEKIARNKKLMRTFTPEQRAAIEQVVRGGKITNTLRNLGKFDPAKGGMGASLGGVIGGGGGAALGGIFAGPIGAGGGAMVGSTALGGAAHLAARGALRRTRANVEGAREALVGRGLPPTADELGAALREAGMVRPSAIEGELMPREPLALPAPEMVAGMRSAPGTAFSREQMGMTPDVERAGALHPSAPRQTERTAPALPLLPPREAPPIVIDAQGRAALAPELAAYLDEIGLSEVRGARQPRAEPAPTQNLFAQLSRSEEADRAGAAFEAERAAAAARGGIDVQELPVREIVLESPPSAAAAATPSTREIRNALARLADPVEEVAPEPIRVAAKSAVATRSERRPKNALAQLAPGGARTVEAIEADLKKLEAKAQRLPQDEPFDSPRMKAIESEYEQLRKELATAKRSAR